jgi:hypothetical protein
MVGDRMGSPRADNLFIFFMNFSNFAIKTQNMPLK